MIFAGVGLVGIFTHMAQGDDTLSRGTLVTLGLLAGVVLVVLFVFMSLLGRGKDDIYKDPHSAGQNEQLHSGQDLWRDPHAPRPYLGPDSPTPARPGPPARPASQP